MRTPLAILLAALLSACSAPEPAAPAVETNALPAEKRITPELERAHSLETDNLLNIGYGASVVSRTAELMLDNSAVRAIDGDAESMWATPGLDFEQTLVFSLPAPARIERVGVRTPAAAVTRTKVAAIDLSSDGTTWSEATILKLEPKTEPQLFDIAPRDAQFIRVRTLEGGTRYAALQSVHLRGTWTGQPVVPEIEGCWRVNNEPASFASASGRVSGTIGDHQLDGGRIGPVYRFAWARGGAWGYAMLTLTPDGRRLSGIRWHEEAAQHSFGTSWFGDRQQCGASPAKPGSVVALFLRRAGWYPLFSLHFDDADQLIESESAGGIEIIADVMRRVPGGRIRIVSREYRERSDDANRRRSVARIDSLKAALARRGMNLSNVDFAALGTAEPRRPTATEPMRLLYGVVEVEIPAEARSSF